MSRAVEIDRIDDPLAVAPGLQQPALAQPGEVERKRRVRQVEQPGDLAGRMTFRAPLDEVPEYGEAGLLGKAGEGLNGIC